MAMPAVPQGHDSSGQASHAAALTGVEQVQSTPWQSGNFPLSSLVRVVIAVRHPVEHAIGMSRLCVQLALLVLTGLSSNAADWQPLFNGRDLTGWKANVMPESFSVVAGAIRVNATRESAHLFFVGDGKDDFVRFKNFELEATVRGETNSNSGIFIHTDRTTRDQAQHLAKGYEIQLNNSVRDPRKTGSLYAVVDLNQSPVDETQWFRVHVIVRDSHITIFINDRKTVDYTEPPHVKRPPERAGRKLDPNGGAIALQAHDPKSVYYFKDIRIKRLP